MRPPHILTATLLLASCGHPESHSARAPASHETSRSAGELAAEGNAEFAYALRDPDLEIADEPEPETEPEPTARRKLLGKFELTYYWMAQEGKAGARNTTLYSPRCKPIAKVSRKYARRLSMEGTGLLRDGRTVNVARSCGCGYSPCFFVAKKAHRWGVGVKSRPLSPFRSIAVDKGKIPYGTTVYIAELDGLTMPGAKPYGGFVHDGCVTADDTGGGVKGRQVDFFTARWSHYKALFERHKLTQVTVYDGKGICDVDHETERTERNSI